MTTATHTVRATPARSFVRAEKLPGSPTAVRKALSRAVKAGELVRMRPGVYYKGVPTRYGMTTPPETDVANFVLGERGVGPAGYSAARAWGVTTQVPAVVELATLGSRRKLKHTKLLTRSNLARVDLNAKEIALLELLREPHIYVEAGWDALVEQVREAVADGSIRPVLLRTAVPGESSRAVRDWFAELSECVESLRV